MCHKIIFAFGCLQGFGKTSKPLIQIGEHLCCNSKQYAFLTVNINGPQSKPQQYILWTMCYRYMLVSQGKNYITTETLERQIKDLLLMRCTSHLTWKTESQTCSIQVKHRLGENKVPPTEKVGRVQKTCQSPTFSLQNKFVHSLGQSMAL